MVLIVGIGNTLRRDDGAGCLFAQVLAGEFARAGIAVTLELRHQLTPELALDLAELQPAALVFVDASIAVAHPTLTALAAEPGDAVGHSLTPTALLALARQLYGIATPAWLVQTPAVDFDHGEGLSAAAQRGVDAAPALASTLLATLASAA